jgi:DNA-binding MarR family transcriptional regulator
MGIDLALRMQSAENEFEKAVTNLIYTHNWVLERFKMALDAHNLTTQQYNILRILSAAQKPLSTMQIRDLMLDKMSDTSRIVDRLVAKELVTKSVSATDKRLVDVVITSKGTTLLDHLDRQTVRMDRSLENLDVAEIRTLNSLLDKIRHDEVSTPKASGILRPVM